MDKLDCRNPDAIILIESEIAHFLSQVRPDVRVHLSPDKIGTPMLPDLRVMGPASATGAVQNSAGPARVVHIADDYLLFRKFQQKPPGSP